MMEAVGNPAARGWGLGRLWAWVRRAVVRPAGQRAAGNSLSTHKSEEDELPVEPRGAVVRGSVTAQGEGSVFDPIRRGLAEVPPLPHVVRELMRELSDPASSARSVARIAASDPALAASLIRTVNSAALGVRRKITSVAEAVSFLGYSMVRSLVIRMRLQQVMPARGAQAAYDAEDLWVHALAVAYAAEALADRCPGVDRGFVCTLGLLHDIGKLAINSYFPSSADEIRTPSADYPGESFLDRERRVLGGDHAEIGAMLAAHWKLPADLIEAIRWHHAPQDAPVTMAEEVRRATILVHVANQLAKYCYVYGEDMEIDIVGDELLRGAGLPGPLTRLLNQRVRGAISRAIFFADESAGDGVGAIRRFLRLERFAKAAPASAEPATHPRGGGDLRVGWVEEDWRERLFAPAVEVDCASPAIARIDGAMRGAGRSAVFTSRCTAGGVERLLTLALAHQGTLGLEERATLPARFVLRRLLSNLAEIAPSDEVEVWQAVREGMLVTAVGCAGLLFARRLGEEVEERVGRRTLTVELANVLNLRWFNRILTTRDGGVLVFITAGG